jgi:predicted esterase
MFQIRSSERVMLCLHGCRQTGDSLQTHCKDLIRFSKQSRIKLIFYTAPYRHPERGNTWIDRPPELSDEYLPSIESKSEYIMSLKSIIEIIKNENVTILLGFSEGACVIDALIRMFHAECESIERVVLLSGCSFPGFESMSIPFHIAVLNVFSDEDIIVKSSDRPKFPSNITVFELQHHKGHNIPQAHEMRIIINFVLGNNELVPWTYKK